MEKFDINEIIKIAKAHDVDAIHPGYGFLSENPDFELLLKEMINDNKLTSCLDPIFEGIIFEDLTAKMFDEIDNIIGSSDFTGVKPATDLTNLKDTKEKQ